MVIWARWGILGLIIPTVFIVVAMFAVEHIPAKDRKPVKQTKVADDPEEVPPAENPAELKAAERKQAAEQRRRPSGSRTPGT